VRVAGRVAVAVAVVSFLAIGLHGRMAKALEKVTVSVSDDGLAWIGRTRRSSGEDGGGLDGARLSLLLLSLLLVRISPNGSEIQVTVAVNFKSARTL